jgi:hypothetical protein
VQFLFRRDRNLAVNNGERDLRDSLIPSLPMM